VGKVNLGIVPTRGEGGSGGAGICRKPRICMCRSWMGGGF
jgi:hypothetical protein